VFCGYFLASSIQLPNQVMAYKIIFSLLIGCCLLSCTNNSSKQNLPVFNEDETVNALIEIPAGTNEKWELNKSTHEIELEYRDGKPRIINYLGYPGNYGMIPKTILSKDKGGDGDPLDILIIGPPIARGDLVKTKIIGVLYLNDSGEQDDKLIGVSEASPLFGFDDLKELDKTHDGILEIIELWFTNYKGSGIIKSNGYGTKQKAIEILKDAMKQYDELSQLNITD
jgi:inorganic pyrophosphatase